MNILEITLTSIALAMDAFTVSICKGLTIRNIKLREYLIIGIYFGTFQAIMPLIGYTLGNFFSIYIKEIDHWVAFALLTIIGINMINDSFSDKGDLITEINMINTFFLALATSIDAMIVGVTFSFLKTDLLKTIIIIGTITFLLSIIGIKFGQKFGEKYEKKSQIIGGIIIILIGIKILLSHLNIFF